MATSARGIRAGRAFVEFFPDDSKLAPALPRTEKRLKAFGDHIRNMGLKIARLGTVDGLGAENSFGERLGVTPWNTN